MRAGCATSRENNEIDVRCNERFALRTITRHIDEDIFWQKLVKNRVVLVGDQGRDFTRFGDYRVSCDERGKHGLLQHENREVPRRDCSNHTERFKVNR